MNYVFSFRLYNSIDRLQYLSSHSSCLPTHVTPVTSISTSLSLPAFLISHVSSLILIFLFCEFDEIIKIDRLIMGDKTQKIVSTEPVRSRWTPKPEQILLLESIFNSGMVNPPKDETVRIRKLLEKFGPVGDVNVFYWFQNRRSRSRRRQKQMQAGIGMRMSAGASVDNRPYGVILGDSIHMAIQTTTSSSSSNSSGTRCGFLPSSSANSLVGDDTADDLFTISRQMGFPGVEEAPAMMIPTSSTSSTGDGLHCQSTASLITVFINGVLTEVPGGRIDMRKMFGNDMILVHSSGEIVPSTEYGVLLQGLQIGESYFLVSKPSL